MIAVKGSHVAVNGSHVELNNVFGSHSAFLCPQGLAA